MKQLKLLKRNYSISIRKQMKPVNKFKVFTWDRILLYLLPPSLLLVALVAAIVHGTTPLIGYVILSVVTVAWFAMSSVLFTDRYRFSKQIKGYTQMGTG